MLPSVFLADHIQMAQSFSDFFDTILDIMDDIGHLLQAYDLFTTAYQRSDKIMQCLVDAYKSIIDFWRSACKVLSKSPLRMLGTVFFKPLTKQWEKSREGLHRSCMRVQVLAQATEGTYRKERDDERKEDKKARVRREVIEWIKGGEDDGNLDMRSDHDRHLKMQQDGTCEWLFETDEYQQWRNNTDHKSALWLQAGPGCGKTVLSSYLVRRLEEEKLRVVYFFFSFDDPSKKKLITALRSIALQLIRHAKDIDSVIDLYNTEVFEYHTTSLRETSTATKIIKLLLQRTERVHIIIDGLDECATPDLATELSNIYSGSVYGIVKWYFSSRNDSIAQTLASETNAVLLNPPKEKLDADIRKLLQKDLSCNYSLNYWAEKCDGNILWASLMLRVIRGEETTCEEQLENELEKFPKDLTGWYLRSLKKLSSKKENFQELARKIFALLVVAEQPLRVSELRNALGIRIGAGDFSKARVPKEGLVEELCGPLVSFDRGNCKKGDCFVKFSHKSVQDFMTQDPSALGIQDEGLRKYFVDINKTQPETGLMCLTYLSYDRYQRDGCADQIFADDSGQDHAFLKYAAVYWYWHLMDKSNSEIHFEDIKKFLLSKSFWTCLAVQSRTAPYLFARLTDAGNNGFAISSTGNGQQADITKVNFAYPLPDWLDEHENGGEGLIKGLLAYIKEWHPILTTTPEAIHECLTSVLGKVEFPYRRTPLSATVRTLKLPISGNSPTKLAMLQDENGVMKLSCIPSEGSHDAFQCLELVGDDSYKTLKWSALEQSAKGKDNPHIVDSTETTIPELTSVQFLGGRSSPSDQFPSSKSLVVHSCSSDSPQGQRWTVFHASNPREGGSKPTKNSGEESDDDYYSDDDSGFGSNSEESDNGDSVMHYVVVVEAGSQPKGVKWVQDADTSLQVIAGVHPSEPLALFSHEPHIFSILNFDTAKVETKVLPEPVTASFTSANAIYKGKNFQMLE
jgi:hypothetical protein